MKHPLFAALAAPFLLAPFIALADPVAPDAAGALLYHPEHVEVVRYNAEGLSDQEVQILASVAQGQNYYAAVAFAPADGLMSEATVMAANHHSVEAARAAALAECESRRANPGRCVTVMEVRPAGWTPRDLQLSADATAAFGENFPEREGVMAISPSAGLWGMAAGVNAPAEALAACAEAPDAPAGDCVVVIAE
ncbi:MAG TPA: 5-aminolevulic acid synthase [Paracoccus sp.]|nr:5-aminolevulic acid synthase [Paracoccus sp. (in: a-proteobacteria)]